MTGSGVDGAGGCVGLPVMFLLLGTLVILLFPSLATNQENLVLMVAWRNRQ